MTAHSRTERLNATAFDRRTVIELARSATPIVGDGDSERAMTVHQNRLLEVATLADYIGRVATDTRKSRADRSPRRRVDDSRSCTQNSRFFE